ncbi:EamA family transporter RarD [Siminovitchia sp. 179-K 8D1 HS]|uniref:EamA family transporter RarD n=1 Tax=Siminovitchia sp. 179-K 8D1 HS TaxID=3142385 RepID=UPI00399FF797
MNKKEHGGIFYGTAAYFMWGILPVYWKLMDHIPAGEVLAHRIFWSFWFMLLLMLFSGKVSFLMKNIKNAIQNWRTLLAFFGVSFLITINWFIFIWAVNMEKVVETSLGYYINPLVSIILGVVVLKERLAKIHVISFFLAVVGVVILTLAYGQFPWISFALAFSFGLYGLMKKMIVIDSESGLAIETLLVMPVAFIYLAVLAFKGDGSFLAGSPGTNLLLAGSGAVTALPLLFFAKGVQRVPLYLMGFLQYIAPSIMLVLGVLLYKEPFGTVRLIAFAFIWGALALFSLSSVKWPHLKRKAPDKTA